jgi:hypothetical protein
LVGKAPATPPPAQSLGIIPSGCLALFLERASLPGHKRHHYPPRPLCLLFSTLAFRQVRLSVIAKTRDWKQPPWIAFPAVSPDEWPRPDDFNDYCREWAHWFCLLSDDEQAEYRFVFQEPPRWHGFYGFLLGN